MPDRPRDVPRAELMAHAQKVIEYYDDLGIPAEVHFKATCPACGARPLFREPNVCFEQMECDYCGVIFDFVAGGYALVLKQGGGPHV